MIRQLLPVCSEISGADELEAFYQLPPGPSHLRVNFVSTLDGVIEVNGRSQPLGNAADRAAFMAMRAVADAIVVGAGTVRAERYGPVRLDEPARARRRDRDQSELPRLAIITAQGDLDPQARVFGGSERPVIWTTDVARRGNAALAAVAEVIVCGEQHVDLSRARQELESRGWRRLLCEGGPALFQSLLVNGLVDELCLSLSPMLAGSEHRHLTSDSPLPELAEFELIGLLEGDGMIIGRFGKVRPA